MLLEKYLGKRGTLICCQLKRRSTITYGDLRGDAPSTNQLF